MSFVLCTKVMATTNVAGQLRFTKDALKQIAEQCAGKPVYLDFDVKKPPIGRVIGAHVTEFNTVVAEVSLNEKYRDYFVVPAVGLENDVDYMNITKLQFLYGGATETPADGSLLSCKVSAQWHDVDSFLERLHADRQNQQKG